MILSTSMLLDRLQNYSNPYTKIGRLVKEGKIFSLTRGLYEDNEGASPLYLANAIYGPSYVSFNYALMYYGLIPERVYDVTSATTEKLKRKAFKNRFGSFSYRDIPLEAFPYGIKVIKEGDYTFMMASKEKALCDRLYELPPVKSQKELEYLLFVDLRIDESEFETLHREDIYFIAPKYHSTNLNYLASYLRRKYHE